MEFQKTLAKELGVREGDTEVVAAVKDSVALRAQVKAAVGATKDTTEVLTAEVVALAADRKDLVSLRKALGATVHEDAVSRVAVLLEAEGKLKALEPEHAAMKARLAEQDKAKAEADVAEVMASRKLPEEVKDALLALRLTKPDQFAAKFPALGAAKVALTRPGVAAAAAPIPAAQAGASEGTVIDLSGITGRNPTHRLAQWIRNNEPAMAKASDEAVLRRAWELRRTGRVAGE